MSVGQALLLCRKPMRALEIAGHRQERPIPLVPNAVAASRCDVQQCCFKGLNISEILITMLAKSPARTSSLEMEVGPRYLVDEPVEVHNMTTIRKTLRPPGRDASIIFL